MVDRTNAERQRRWRQRHPEQARSERKARLVRQIAREVAALEELEPWRKSVLTFEQVMALMSGDGDG